MSPRAPSSVNQRSLSTPYSRRPIAHPKSSRQQFSACGACRMRRVRCDLKDLPYSSASPHSACSNCKERGLKCVDEFGDVKAVKLLRRGRRLQQVEAIYGKGQNLGSSSSSPPETRLPGIIPQLAPEFFNSPFWKWFTIQRPILDPVEFPARFIAHTKGVRSLGNEGGLLAMVLVVWAASFGLNERGVEDVEDVEDYFPNSEREISPAIPPTQGPHQKPGSNLASKLLEKESALHQKRKEKKEKTDAMLREVLELIDFHGVMRRPTWDGVRVLLLILPLMEEAHPLERLAIYEATLSQTQALCTLSGPSGSIHPGLDPPDDALIRAQIFWYAYMHEGVTTGIRGGRLVLNTDDFEAFQDTLPHFGLGGNSSGFPSPSSSSSSLRPLSSHGPTHTQQAQSQHGSQAQSFLHLSQLFSLPLQLSAVCRKVHSVLTGPKAVKKAEEHGLIDAHGMREIWDDLDHYWKAFETMRRTTSDTLDTERYVSAWQIFIFECHNMIRESLKQYMSLISSDGQLVYSSSSSSRPPSYSSSSPYLSPHYLYATATRKCLGLLPLILSIIKLHLSQDRGGELFAWDAGLVRDGCFFAGYLAANIEGDTIDFPTEDRNEENTHGSNSLSVEDGITLCLSALAEMKWASSRSEEREETVRMVWENQKIGRSASRYSLGDTTSHHTHPDANGYSHFDIPPMAYFKPTAINVSQGLNPDRLLPPLHLRSPRRVESAPSTGYTTTGHGANGWPSSYTPPRTATSVTTSAGTGVSARGSPQFAALTGSMTFKSDPQETIYNVNQDLEQFSFNVPVSGQGINDTTIGHYHHYDPPSSAHSLPGATSPAYLDSSVFALQDSGIVHPSRDIPSCPQYGDNSRGFYH